MLFAAYQGGGFGFDVIGPHAQIAVFQQYIEHGAALKQGLFRGFLLGDVHPQSLHNHALRGFCKGTHHMDIAQRTRAGENTKIIFTGDIYQIDTPYLDSHSNGLSTLIDRIKHHPIYAHIRLEKGERSELANLANTLL